MGEGALFIGIALYFMNGGVPDAWAVWAVAITLTGLAGGLIVSYTRARAEGLDLECKVGLAQRAERIVGLGVPTLLFGPGPNGTLLFGIVTVLTLLSLMTVVQRIYHVYQLTNQPTTNERAVKTLSGEPAVGEPVPRDG